MGNVGYELPPELLQLISGGTMTEEEKQKGIQLISAYKKNGSTKENIKGMLALVSGFNPNRMMSKDSECTVDEFMKFIDDNWDTI